MMSSVVSLLKKIKQYLPWMWDVIEYLNGRCVRLFYGRRIDRSVQNALDKVTSQYQHRRLKKEDAYQLFEFINRQPAGFDKFFKPHGFAKKDFKRVLTNGTFVLIGTFDNDKLTGYCFIRFFMNKSAFRGKIVDREFQGRGIAKEMGVMMSRIASNAGFRVYATISKDNVASLRSAQHGSSVEVIRELPDNYLYVEIKATE